MAGSSPAMTDEGLADHGGEVGDVDIAASDVAEVILMRPLLDVTDAILRHDRAVTIAEAVDGCGPNAAARVAAGDDHRVDALLGEVVVHAGAEEDRRALLGHREIVGRVIDARIERDARMVVAERLAHGRDLPIRHLALAHIGGVAHRDRHVVSAGNPQQLGRILDRARYQGRATERVLRVGEADLEIHHHDAGLAAEADRDLAVAAVLVIVHLALRPAR
jgi:hypothetical protein